MMPFHDSFDDVYNVIRTAVNEVAADLKIVRLDEVLSAGKISDDLVTELSRASLCIADVSGANPNVMWEVGYATALRKPIVAINDKSGVVPFDIRDVRSVMYDRSALTKTLRSPLQEAIKQTLDIHSIAATSLRSQAPVGKSTIAVTGTMNCPPDKARARLERALAPYFGRGAFWYIGSFGVVDESAAEILLDAGEKNVTVVGYGAHDISGKMREIVRDNKSMYFVDALEEQVPYAVGAPSFRDVIFAARCDTLFIGWDGISEGTRELINWLAEIKKDHQVVFVSPLYNESSPPLTR